MKRKDLALLAGILILSILISLVISNLIFGGSGSRQQQVEVVSPISAQFPVDQVSGPDKQFNSNAVNPAQLIQIGQPNDNPFNGNANSPS